MPEFFYEWLGTAKTSALVPWFHWTALQVGIRHESNGKDDPESRSVNMGYVRPAVVLGRLDGWNLTITPRFKGYFRVTDDNRDIQRYRDNSDVQLVFGKNAGLKIGVATDTGKGNIQVDVTHPVRIPLIGLETYVLLQYFEATAKVCARTTSEAPLGASASVSRADRQCATGKRTKNLRRARDRVSSCGVSFAA